MHVPTQHLWRPPEGHSSRLKRYCALFECDNQFLCNRDQFVRKQSTEIKRLDKGCDRNPIEIPRRPRFVGGHLAPNSFSQAPVGRDQARDQMRSSDWIRSAIEILIANAIPNPHRKSPAITILPPPLTTSDNTPTPRGLLSGSNTLISRRNCLPSIRSPICTPPPDVLY